MDDKECAPKESETVEQEVNSRLESQADSKKSGKTVKSYESLYAKVDCFKVELKATLERAHKNLYKDQVKRMWNKVEAGQWGRPWHKNTYKRPDKGKWTNKVGGQAYKCQVKGGGANFLDAIEE